MRDERKHVNQTSSHTQMVEVERTFLNFECRHCDETFSVDDELGFQEIRGEIHQHLRTEHPEKA